MRSRLPPACDRAERKAGSERRLPREPGLLWLIWDGALRNRAGRRQRRLDRDYVSAIKPHKAFHSCPVGSTSALGPSCLKTGCRDRQANGNRSSDPPRVVFFSRTAVSVIVSTGYSGFCRLPGGTLAMVLPGPKPPVTRPGPGAQSALHPYGGIDMHDPDQRMAAIAQAQMGHTSATASVDREVGPRSKPVPHSRCRFRQQQGSGPTGPEDELLGRHLYLPSFGRPSSFVVDHLCHFLHSDRVVTVPEVAREESG